MSWRANSADSRRADNSWRVDSPRPRPSEDINPNQPIEQQILSSDSFRKAVDVALRDAENVWAPLRIHDRIGIWEGMATLHGEVSQNQPFQTVIDEKQYLVLKALRTKYVNADDVCELQIVADGISYPVFILDGDTRYLVFSNCFIIRPERDLIFSIKGKGTLQFSCVGATAYKNVPYATTAFNVVDVGEQSKIVPVETPEVGTDDARLRAFVRSWERQRNGET